MLPNNKPYFWRVFFGQLPRHTKFCFPSSPATKFVVWLTLVGACPPFRRPLKVWGIFYFWPALFGKRAATFAAAAAAVELTFPFTTSNKLCKMKTINQQQQRRAFSMWLSRLKDFSRGKRQQQKPKQKSKQQRRKWICCLSCWPLLLTAFVAVVFYELGYYVCWVIEYSFFAHTNECVHCCFSLYRCRLGSCLTCNMLFYFLAGSQRFYGRWGWFLAICKLRCKLALSL